MSSSLIDRQTVAAGAYVFREGDAAGSAYIIQEGSVEIVKISGDQETVLATIPKSGIFGEMALIDDSPRMAAARMAEGGTLIVINRQTFEAKMAKCDPFVRTLLRMFVETIRDLQARK